MTNKLQAKIEKFLSERRKSANGEWAEITDGDVQQLHDVIHDLIEAKCEADADGDRPINFVIVDRRKYEPLHFRPLPYRYQITTLEGFSDWLRMATFNLSIAAEQMKAVDHGLFLLTEKK